MATFLSQPCQTSGNSPGDNQSQDGKFGISESAGAFSIAQFLQAESEKDMLRLSTAGSVDDGKSTLIGRLLYDSRNVYEDHVRSVTRSHGGAARSSIDFALLTDGLRAEREQGITIDVAYRYFSTARRKFIIADTPGHEQYTRNMATGASTADLAVILIDATKGLLTQSRRHVYIASLLGIRHLVAVINKMDLVDCSAEVFHQLEREFVVLVGQLGGAEIRAIPVSALDGDNVVERSTRMPWYHGPTLLEHLEAVPARRQTAELPFRLPVQRVIWTGQDHEHRNFRGFAGQIAAGSVAVGDSIVALPSGRTSHVSRISTFDGDLQYAAAPQSIAVTLEDEIDVSRGDLISSSGAPPASSRLFTASAVWFDDHPLDLTTQYLLKHTAQTVNARIRTIHHRVNVATLEQEPADSLSINDIGLLEIETSRPIFFDPYQQNRATGSFILIDPSTNATVAAGMIHGHHAESGQGEQRGREEEPKHDLSGAAVIAPPGLVAALESALHARNVQVVRTRLSDPATWRALVAAGFLVLVEATDPSLSPGIAYFSGAKDEPRYKDLDPTRDLDPVASILEELRHVGLLSPESGDNR